MLLTAGRALLILALLIALYGIVASVYGARSRRREWVDSGRRAVYALAGVLLGAFAILESAFLRSDFTFALVGSHSSTTTPTFYQATAMWSSQEGSLLLWVVLLAVWSSAILFLARRRMREVVPWATAVLLGYAAFFCALLVFLESPFQAAAPVPVEGAGLNPLLRHPSMMIHPPLLYSGYTLFAVPFAFAIGALIVRRTGAEWIRTTRPFTLAAWTFLGAGIILGARWSYSELGWGGYWAWDPVENASLMPWLTGTAFLHSMMIQEKRGMLKVWNVSLILATGILAILGTFLVRSGILESIHAFGASTLGVPFLCLIVTMIAGSIALVATRARELRSEHRLDSLLSREAIFLLNNLVLVGMCFVIFWGTFFPLISEALTGTEASVGPPWFNQSIVPLALLLVLLTGVGPVIAWRRATPANLRRNLLGPALAGVAVGVVLAVLGVGERPLALLLFVLAAFAIAVAVQELWRGVRARRAMTREPVPVALVSLVGRNRRRYGGYLVHVGIAVLFVGVAASSAFQDSREVRLGPGETVRVDGYDIRYERPVASIDRERISLGAVLSVGRPGEVRREVLTQREYYPSRDRSLGPIGAFFEGEATSEIGLEAGLWRDVWTAIRPAPMELRQTVDRLDERFADASPEQQATAVAAFTALWEARPTPSVFFVIVSPLVSWIWIGALLVIAGALVAVWPAPAGARSTVGAAYKARVARELEHA